MSDSVRPHKRQPTRLHSPCDSPGKNTGVGCHFLLQCRKVKSEREVAQSCPTLHDPMDCSPPGSSVHGIFQLRVLEWGAIAFSSYTTQWLDISIHFKLITMIILLTMCHHTKILHSYSLYFPHWINFIPWLIYFVIGSFYILISLTYFFPPASPLLSGNHLFALCIYNCFFFVHFFCILDSTHKWNHTLFVFLSLSVCFISLSIGNYQKKQTNKKRPPTE